MQRPAITSRGELALGLARGGANGVGWDERREAVELRVDRGDALERRVGQLHRRQRPAAQLVGGIGERQARESGIGHGG